MTPGEFDLLSAYLDDSLSESERSALEKRLADDPALRAELNHLRSTIQLLRNAPVITPPRNFTLDPARYRRALPWWANYRAMGMIGAVGSAAAVLLIVFGIITSGLASAPASSVVNIASLPTITSNVNNSPVVSESTQTEDLLDSTTTHQAAPTTIAIQPSLSLPYTSSPAAQAASADEAGATSSALQQGAQGGQGSNSVQPPTETQTLKSAGGAAINSGAAGVVAETPAIGYAVTSAPTATIAVPAPLAPGSSTTSAAKAAVLPTTTETVTFAPLPTDTLQSPTLPVPTSTPIATNAQKTNEVQTVTLSASRLLTIAGIALLVFSGMLLGLAYLRSRL